MLFDGFKGLWDSDKGQLVIAGAMGGVVRWLTLRESWQEGVVSLAVGGIMALYVGPVAIPLVGPMLSTIVVDHDSVAGFSGLMVGLSGMTVARWLMDVWSGRISDVEKSGSP